MADLELLSTLELDYRRINAGQIMPGLPVQDYSTEAVQKGVIQTGVSAPKGGNSPAQEHG